MTWVQCGFLFLCLLHGYYSLESSASQILINTDRIIDVSSQVVKITVKYELTNKGKSDFNSFIHVVTNDEHSRLSYIVANEEKKSGKLRVMKVDVPGIAKGFVAYKVELLIAVPPEGKISVAVDYYLTEYLTPYPAKISQSEVQYMVYKGNAHVSSMYPVAKETTKVVLPSGRLVSHTTVNPSKHEGTKITYGPYTDQKSFAFAEIRVHYENNSPFLVATDVLRHIEVSHWGNIAVEELINVVHKGATLKGSFSRLDFQLDRRGAKRPVVTQYKTLLPVTAKDIYYRDEIGNISTSSIKKLNDAVEMTIQPRFPLFGGWQTNYVLGYNLPAYQYLFSSGNSFALKMRLLDHLFDNAVVEHLKVKIVLPEGSKNFKLITPYSVKRGADELHYTYLDTIGRPVIIIEKDNLVDAHIQPFTLHYEFDRVQLWREPLLACAAFSVLFLIVIFYVRLDFTIVSDPVKESRMQAQGQIERLSEIHADWLKLYDHFYDIALKYVSNKDSTAYTANKKKTENDAKALSQAFTSTHSELKLINGDIYEKFNEVSKLHKRATDVVNDFLAQAERLVSNPSSKSAFTTPKDIYMQKMNEIKDKMDNIIYSL